MSSIIQQIELEQRATNVPNFRAGDTVIVKVKVIEGNRERLQAFEGIVIAKKDRSAFTVRKISHGVGVERVFQTDSKQIDSITVKRRGRVRRAKLYYMRDRSGKKARIAEDLRKSRNNPDKIVEEAPATAAPKETAETKPTEQPPVAAKAENAPEVKAEKAKKDDK